jgi:hypothetical protein
MSVWRCPHCGTPQAETARCWVCHRSSTTCSTCRHFRRGVAGQLGFCGLDRRRTPITGIELRGCWQAGANRQLELGPKRGPVGRARAGTPRGRDFVPVELHRDPPAGAPRASGAAKIDGARRATDAVAPVAASGALEPPAVNAVSVDAWAERVTLFGEGDG